MRFRFATRRRRTSVLATRSKASSSRSVARFSQGLSDMNAIRIAAACAVAVLALTSCKKVLNKGEESFHTLMVNLISDSATVQYKIDTTAVSSAAYQAGTALAAAHPG